MKALVIALFAMAGIGLAGLSAASAAPASGPGIAAATSEIGHLQPVWWDRYGRWHPNRVYVGPPPYYAPACRSVRICGPYGCYWRRRCY